MPDQKKCTCSTPPLIPPPFTPPPIPEDDGDRVLRETFLWRFRLSEDRGALVHFLAYLDNLMWEWGEAGEGPLLYHQFSAVAADLQHLAAYLQRIASTPEVSPAHLGEHPICCAAAQWSKRVADLSDEIRHGVAATWGGDHAD